MCGCQANIRTLKTAHAQMSHLLDTARQPSARQVGARQAQAAGSGSPHGMRASGTGYPIRSITADLLRGSRTSVPCAPKSPSEPSQSAAQETG